jgi:hypothetical protein
VRRLANFAAQYGCLTLEFHYRKPWILIQFTIQVPARTKRIVYSPGLLPSREI